MYCYQSPFDIIVNTVKYLPFGEARGTINIPTDKLFTGQRLDSCGLYYYNAPEKETGSDFKPEPGTALVETGEGRTPRPEEAARDMLQA